MKGDAGEKQSRSPQGKILEQKNAAGMKQTKTPKTAFSGLDKRLVELDKLVVATYEDKVKRAIQKRRASSL